MTATETPLPQTRTFSAETLRRVCLEEGADDAGFVEIGRAALEPEQASILRVYPKTRTLIALVQVMNRENLQSTARYVANDEFHHTIDGLTETARRIVRRLNALGIRGVVPTVGFPMDMDRWGDVKIWDVSHKTVAEQAGLGRMGIHRNVIHPRFGNFILLETILIDAEVDGPSRPIPYNPCLTCNLCVAVCPVGAVRREEPFDFATCMTHNYREFMGGFQEWTETVAGAGSASAYREQVRDSETLSMWQSLAFGPNYKAAYCMAVCPAGEDVHPLYEGREKEYIDQLVRPFKEKPEPVYVRPGTRAEQVARRNPRKEIRPVVAPLRPASIAGFLRGLPLVFNPLRAKGHSVRMHFRFTGGEMPECILTVRDGQLTVSTGPLEGAAGLRVTVDPATWLGIVNRERSPLWAFITGRLKVRGNPVWLLRLQQWTSV